MSECNCVDTGHKQDCPLGKDLRIAAMQEQIAILETSLAERWENLNVQDGIIDGLQEEIAALRAIARSAAQEEETKLDENQFITQQSRIVKLAALREAGYLKEEG